MPGRAGRSGHSKEWVPFNPSEPAPKLDGTIEQAEQLLAWTTSELANGNMDARQADSFAARAAIVAIRTKFQQREMDELRQLVARQEAAIAALTKAEQEARYQAASAAAATANVSFGRVRVSSDGDPH
jgi:hypothetical protein